MPISTSSKLRLFLYGCTLAFVASLASNAGAQTLTWDPDSDQTNNGGAGLWDLVSTSWDDDGTAPNVSWTNGANAIFGDAGTDYTVGIASGGVTVGDLSLSAGTGNVGFLADTDGQGITVAAGGATWDLGGRGISFINNNDANDTALFMTSGDTLTITGSGLFDTGEKPGGANWGVAGATLDFQGTTLRGNAGSIGQFSSVKLADGSTFIHERNTPQTYNNDWELTGTVTFTNRFNREANLNGVVSGSGTLVVEDMGGLFVRLNNTSNSFTGGVIVDSTDTRSELLVIGSDANFGAAPIAFDADHITLRNGGELKLNGVTINANRGITLDGGGIIVNSGSENSYGGTITGTGGLQIGRQAGGDANNLVLTSNTNDYTGGTQIFRGSVQLGIDNALSSAGVLTIGGQGTTEFRMNGFSQELAGLELLSGTSNARQIQNDGATVSTLTLNVASGESYEYAGNFVGTNNVNLVKTGEGTQIFTRPQGYTTDVGTINVDQGGLVWNVVGGGDTTVGVNGTLSGNGTFNGDVAVAGNLFPGTSPGIMTFNGDLDLLASSFTTIEFDSLASFDVLASDGTGVFTAGGTLNFALTGYSPVEADEFVVFSNWSTFSGNFAAINGTDLGNGYSFDTSTLLTDGTVRIAFTAVPEPSSALLLIAGVGIFVARRRRNV